MTDFIDQAIAGNGLVAAFQQVVELPSETIVGYEALARWPSLDNPSPLDIFDRAAKTGRLDRLDELCIRAATQGAVQRRFTPGALLLVNCEPATPAVDPTVDADVMRAAGAFRLTFEITERGLLTNPRALLRKVAALRSLGFAIALDDIGSDPDSLVLLDVVAPDILKLDMGLVQRQPDRMHARTVAGIIAHHERTGAVICAEGIETADHLEQALAYGATLGQGNWFGAPGEVTSTPKPFDWPARRTPCPPAAHHSTMDLAIAGLPTRTVRKQTLTALSHHIGGIAATAQNAPIVLATLHPDEHLDLHTEQMYSAIAERSPLVAVFGRNSLSGFGPRVRGVTLHRDDPLLRESTLLVLGPETACGLIARERPSPAVHSVDAEKRRYDMVITYDHQRVTAAARPLLDRLV
ncbi:EAL domain-containing protein (putative c-di-GMP-specific phosphodiesterase class I) [Mycobacterium sp. BK086]|uniref:sensor domain-containing phosphodiesterase n=1 Tax=Mycobacterium sp. BK086 TaxID=2512165 RepID=UPI00105E2920|nr:EAL domain-containing protein [Mycobacterium sp. BK086]TDO08996.1 EAL domain-containing protein (putative c-di-GMP-specific phosphodiesterase class I) [Mycobacterium sp. BK086]